MAIVIIDHARRRMPERGVSEDDVREVLARGRRADVRASGDHCLRLLRALGLAMKISYDAKCDVLYLKLAEGAPSVTTRHLDDDISVDIDEAGRIAGIEVLSASKHVDLGAVLPVGVEE